MKLLSRQKNKYNNITYNLYELKSGIKLIHLENPATVDFDFASIHKAGAMYEDQEHVPHGTAHLLEHMLFNPNTTFKTKDDISAFEEGNKHRPEIMINGSTSSELIKLTGHTNQKGASHLMDRMISLIDFPKDIFKESFDKEKDIVSAERSNDLKTKEDSTLQLLSFLVGKDIPEVIYPITGELGDIKKIKLDDLEKYFKNRFVSENTIFAIQSKNKLSKSITQQIEVLENKYPKSKASSFKKTDLKEKLDLGYFYDKRAEGTNILFVYLLKKSDHSDYKEKASYNLFARLINKVGHETLREKLGLVYSIRSFDYGDFIPGYDFNGFTLTTENQNLKIVFEELNNMIFGYLEDFLKSDRGDAWFEHLLSSYIYPHTIQFNHRLAEDTAYTYLEKKELYTPDKYIEAAKGITKEDLLEKIEELKITAPRIWIETNLKGRAVQKVVKESKLWKEFK
jgi:predicted Zn-dependent peptidase